MVYHLLIAAKLGLLGSGSRGGHLILLLGAYTLKFPLWNQVSRSYHELTTSTMLLCFQLNQIVFQSQYSIMQGRRLERAFRLVRERLADIRRMPPVEPDDQDSFHTLSMIALLRLSWRRTLSKK